VQILEYHSFRKYKQHRKLTDTTAANYAAITFFPDKFESFLLHDVGFRRVTVLDPVTVDLKRPLFVFCK
jgi:Bicoid-interacting protein 3 (Bin3)